MKWLHSWWKNTSTLLKIVFIIVILVVVVLVITVVRLYGTGFAGKTLWDWLSLLGILAIPVVVGFGTIWFTQAQQHRDQLLADRRAQTEGEIAADNQREAAMKEYFSNMSELLLEKNLLRSNPDAEARIVARVLTLTVLHRLDKYRKRSVLQFLKESGLIEVGNKIIDLSGADIRLADLTQLDLCKADLSRAILYHAGLDGAKLDGANLSDTWMNDADLSRARLIGIDLSHAVMVGVNLTESNLTRANLQGALLYPLLKDDDDLEFEVTDIPSLYADLSKADLTGANLTGAKVKDDQLKQAKSLEGATMPDGSKHD